MLAEMHARYSHGSNPLLCFSLYHICGRGYARHNQRDEGEMIRLVLVDDQPSVRQGLRMRLTLEPDMTVVAEASNGREAMILVQQLAPDIVLMDVQMPEL